MLGEMSEVRTGERLGVEILFCKVFFAILQSGFAWGAEMLNAMRKCLLISQGRDSWRAKIFVGRFFKMVAATWRQCVFTLYRTLIWKREFVFSLCLNFKYKNIL